MYMNLLPVKHQTQVVLRTHLKLWALISIICIICGLTVCLHDWLIVKRLQERLARIETKSEPIRHRSKAIVSLVSQLQNTIKRYEATNRIMPPDHNMPLLGMFAEGVRKTNHNVRFLKLAINSALPAARKKNNTNSSTTSEDTAIQVKATIYGMATDSRALSTFVEHLRSSPYFQKIDFIKSTSGSTPTSKGRLQFHLECHH